jgi:hypothetical protein
MATIPDYFCFKKQDYKFHITINPVYIPVSDPKTYERVNSLISYNLNIGAKNNCMHFKIPVSETRAELTMVDTQYGGCNFNKDISNNEIKIRGEITIFYVKIGVQLIREFFPYIIDVELLDTSKFPCTFLKEKNSDKEEVRMIDMSQFEILFKRKSYYESRYNARIIDDDEYQLYLKCIENFYDPSKKKPYFDFNNDILNKVFTPIYERSSTWDHFLTTIKEQGGDKLCNYVEPWYKQAIKDIFENRRSHSFTWVFTIESSPVIDYKKFLLNKKECIPSKIGGNRYTRKKRVSNYNINAEMSALYDETYNRHYTWPPHNKNK